MASLRGIQTWKIPADKIKNWKRLNPDIHKHEATDCVINSLDFLGIFDNKEIAEMLSKGANNKSLGVRDDATLKMIFNSFIKNGFKVYHRIIPKTFSEIRKEIKNNEYTLVIFRRGKGVAGHAVVMTKKDNVLYVYDPQQETCHSELTDLDDEIKGQGYVSMEFLVRDKVKRLPSSTTIKLRKDKNLNERPTKKRRLHSPRNKRPLSPTTIKLRKDKKKSNERSSKRARLSSSTKSSSGKMDISSSKSSSGKMDISPPQLLK